MTIAAALVLASCWTLVSDATAQPEPIDFASTVEGITVTASGDAKVKPNRLEIEIRASGSAELSADAVVKYRDALKHAKEAFAKLKIDNLTIEEQGVIVSANANAAEESDMPVPVQPGARAKQEVGVWKTLRLKMTGLEKLSEEEVVAVAGRLLDVAKDAGLMTGSSPNNQAMVRVNGMIVPNPMVAFVADNSQAAEEKATEAAFQQAKSKAQRLANLAGAQLGRVLSIDENTTVMASEGSYEAQPDRMVSYAFSEVPIRVNLRVRFAIQPAGALK
jgi:uncharacterized protein YggE